jgi:asparagine synthase (glutamine-hydrolysing)
MELQGAYEHLIYILRALRNPSKRQSLKMHTPEYIERVVDLTDSSKNVIYNMTIEQARSILATGDISAVQTIDGQFGLVAVNGKTVRLARSIARPLRYFIAKRQAGPMLVVADRIDAIFKFLKSEGLDDQFHPSYTRMVPAHYVTEISLVGCPDPNPTYHRYLKSHAERLKPELAPIGSLYIQAVYNEIVKWLENCATEGPIGVCFSGGIDSGSVFLLTYHALLELGCNPARLKAFTLAVDGGVKISSKPAVFSMRLDLGFSSRQSKSVRKKSIGVRRSV